MSAFAGSPCGKHTALHTIACINCRKDMCRLCKHYTINSRTWCTTCAKRYVPSAGGEMIDMVRFFIKLLGMALVTGAALVVMPGAIPKFAAAGVLCGLYFRFVMLRTFGDSEILIEEVINGRKKSLS